MAEWLSVSTAVPEHRVSVAETKQRLGGMCPSSAAARLHAMIDAWGNQTRYVALSLDQLLQLDTLDCRNRRYEAEAVRLGAMVATDALARAGVAPGAIEAIVGVSSTGYLMPTLETRLIDRLGLSPTCRRVPLVNLGCAGGAASLGLAATLSGAMPSATVLVVSVELPSLSLPSAERSLVDSIASFQFGDGAAAAVIRGSTGGRGPEVVASGSEMFANSVDCDGVQLTAGGLRLMRPRGLTTLLRERLGDAVDRFLAAQGVSRRDIAFWAIHPRNPELLDAAADSLALPETARAASRAVWRRTGNSISAAVYHVVDELRASAPPAAGALGMIVAFGAGFGCELVLLRAGGWLCGERADHVARRPAGEVGAGARAA